MAVLATRCSDGQALFDADDASSLTLTMRDEARSLPKWKRVAGRLAVARGA